MSWLHRHSRRAVHSHSNDGHVLPELRGLTRVCKHCNPSFGWYCGAVVLARSAAFRHHVTRTLPASARGGSSDPPRARCCPPPRCYVMETDPRLWRQALNMTPASIDLLHWSAP